MSLVDHNRDLSLYMQLGKLSLTSEFIQAFSGQVSTPQAETSDLLRKGSFIQLNLYFCTERKIVSYALYLGWAGSFGRGWKVGLVDNSFLYFLKCE